MISSVPLESDNVDINGVMNLRGKPGFTVENFKSSSLRHPDNLAQSTYSVGPSFVSLFGTVVTSHPSTLTDPGMSIVPITPRILLPSLALAHESIADPVLPVYVQKTSLHTPQAWSSNGPMPSPSPLNLLGRISSVTSTITSSISGTLLVELGSGDTIDEVHPVIDAEDSHVQLHRAALTAEDRIAQQVIQDTELKKMSIMYRVQAYIDGIA